MFYLFELILIIPVVIKFECFVALEHSILSTGQFRSVYLACVTRVSHDAGKRQTDPIFMGLWGAPMAWLGQEGHEPRTPTRMANPPLGALYFLQTSFSGLIELHDTESNQKLHDTKFLFFNHILEMKTTNDLITKTNTLTKCLVHRTIQNETRRPFLPRICLGCPCPLKLRGPAYPL